MAKAKRSFSPAGVTQKQDDYHGGCRFARIKPDIAAQGIQSANIELTFEEALRLSTALQSAILSSNRYNRSTSDGREMGISLAIKTATRAISVIEQKVRTQTD